jgi:hypothetical protein
VGNGNSESYTRTAARLPHLDCFEYLRIVPTHPIDQVPGELSDDAGLVACGDRHDNLLRRENLGQEHGVICECIAQS